MDLNGCTLRSGRKQSKEALHFQGPLGAKRKNARKFQVSWWISRMMQIFLEGLGDVWHAQNGIYLRNVIFMYIPLVKGQKLPGALELQNWGRKPKKRDSVHSKKFAQLTHINSGPPRVPTRGRCFSFSMKYSDITRSIGSRKIVTMQPRPCPLVNCLALLYSWRRFFETCNPCPKNK